LGRRCLASRPPAPQPKPRDKLRPEAADALDDFALFQRRYLGHISTPWQVEAANYIVKLLATPAKEYAALNVPPGVGKSSLMTLDIPAWLVCRDRAIRGATLSNTQHAAWALVDDHVSDGRRRSLFGRLRSVGFTDEYLQVHCVGRGGNQPYEHRPEAQNL